MTDNRRENADKLTLKEMCDLFDVTPRTLRYYEYIELIFPEKKGRTRLYGSAEKARLTLIKRGRRVGFSLEEVRQWLELYDQDPTQTAQMQALLEKSYVQLEELFERRKEVDQAIEELKTMQEHAKKHLKK